MIDFFLKKLLGAFLLPLPAGLILCVLGVLLLFLPRCLLAAKCLLIAGIGTLLIFSLPYAPDGMLKTLESQYPPLHKITGHLDKDVDKIVVLGAGNGGYGHYPSNNKLSSASLSRLVEGIRLYRLIPHAQLILSGGRVFGSPADGVIMNNVAVILGVVPSDIVIENGSRDTLQEAINIKKLVGAKPFILVTSAYHMPRAMSLFRKCGMHPIAAPTQFLLGSKRYSIQQYFPNSLYLVYSDIVMHEYIGTLWAKLHGTVD